MSLCVCSRLPPSCRRGLLRRLTTPRLLKKYRCLLYGEASYGLRRLHPRGCREGACGSNDTWRTQAKRPLVTAPTGGGLATDASALRLRATLHAKVTEGARRRGRLYAPAAFAYAGCGYWLRREACGPERRILSYSVEEKLCASTLSREVTKCHSILQRSWHVILGSSSSVEVERLTISSNDKSEAFLYREAVPSFLTVSIIFSWSDLTCHAGSQAERKAF